MWVLLGDLRFRWWSSRKHSDNDNKEEEDEQEEEEDDGDAEVAEEEVVVEGEGDEPWDKGGVGGGRTKGDKTSSLDQCTRRQLQAASDGHFVSEPIRLSADDSPTVSGLVSGACVCTVQ